jgi:hypothetical protein
MGIGRPLKPGISFYRKDSGHIRNKKVRLLFNEFGGDGYYVWCCLLDYGYEKWGYFFDTTDAEELELFASDFCKIKLTTIREVIAGCLRRGLFDKAVFEAFGILTCEMMQETYIIATAERRQKGSVFEMQSDWLKIDLSAEVPPNIRIVPPKKSILPPNNSIVPRNNSQSIVENSRVEDTKQNNNPNGVAPAVPSPPKILDKKTEESEPYWHDLVKGWFDFHKANKLDEPSFAGKDPRTFKHLIHLLKKRAARKKQEWTHDNATGSLNYFLSLAFKEEWLSNHFTLSNLVEQFDAVYQRSLLEKQKKDVAPAASSSTPQTFNEEIRYMISRHEEGELDERVISPDYFDKLQARGLIPVGAIEHQPGETIEDKKRSAVMQFIKTNSNATTKEI